VLLDELKVAKRRRLAVTTINSFYRGYKVLPCEPFETGTLADGIEFTLLVCCRTHVRANVTSSSQPMFYKGVFLTLDLL
jgi:hypothetical protein